MHIVAASGSTPRLFVLATCKKLSLITSLGRKRANHQTPSLDFPVSVHEQPQHCMEPLPAPFELLLAE